MGVYDEDFDDNNNELSYSPPITYPSTRHTYQSSAAAALPAPLRGARRGAFPNAPMYNNSPVGYHHLPSPVSLPRPVNSTRASNQLSHKNDVSPSINSHSRVEQPRGSSVTQHIPPQFQHLFTARFSHFNAVQSECLDVMLHSSNNVVISSPTASGKTVLMELAIIQLMQENSGGKIIYIAPIKALCSERLKDWQSRFKSLKCNFII